MCSSRVDKQLQCVGVHLGIFISCNRIIIVRGNHVFSVSALVVIVLYYIGTAAVVIYHQRI